MDTDSITKTEVAYEFLPLLRVYKNGHVERLMGTDTIPASLDTKTGVTSKDVNISSQVSARLYVPKFTIPHQKLPVVVYFHGGAFCISSPSTSEYHNYLNAIVARASVVAVSVDYRKVPEHFIPAAYEDSWAALQWVVSHSKNEGPEVWLNKHADFERLFLAGDSAGANIAHNLAIMAGNPNFGISVPILGTALVHPYFWGKDPIGTEADDPAKRQSVDRLWPFICPSNPDNDDPWVNPISNGASSLARLVGCRRVLICVAENDILKDRGRLYYEALRKCGWLGVVEIFETEGEDHAFHLNNLECDKANDLIKLLADFFNKEMPPIA